MVIDKLKTYSHKQTATASLAVFRILFGGLMFLGIIRFWFNGWIEKLYIEPQFFFSYYGFEWIKPLGQYTYLLFLVCGLSALFVALGYKYKIAIVTFFLSFTYIELMDKTTYLNHYYFVSLVSFLMIFLPANAYASIDARQNPSNAAEKVPAWMVDVLKLMLGMVYFYAGLAKLNSDWLIHAMPLKIWLPAGYDLPILGYWLQQTWVHYALSWMGAIYDLTVPFLLLYAATRWFGYSLVIVFHLLTSMLFPIGMFPYLMIGCTLIFFPAKLHSQWVSKLGKWLKVNKWAGEGQVLAINFNSKIYKARLGLFMAFFLVQLILPFRYLLYPGELFWTEEGFRFSWRVMLMEKAGVAQFRVVDPVSGQQFYVNNQDFLTPFQEKQMSFQPDFILEYAQFLKEYYLREKQRSMEVYVDSYVSLNGRISRPYIDPTVDLGSEKESFKSKTWILPFDEEIKGI